MNWLKPTFANLTGAVVAFILVGGDALCSHRDLGDHRLLNDTVISIASAHGFDAITVALMLGGLICLVVSFIVTHVIERLVDHQGPSTRP